MNPVYTLRSRHGGIDAILDSPVVRDAWAGS